MVKRTLQRNADCICFVKYKNNQKAVEGTTVLTENVINSVLSWRNCEKLCIFKLLVFTYFIKYIYPKCHILDTTVHLFPIGKY